MTEAAPAVLPRSVSARRSLPLGYETVTRWLARPAARLHICLLACALTLPALATGLVTDDYSLAVATWRNPWTAFEFSPRDPVAARVQLEANRDAGTAPWWVDEDSRIAFFRPLSSLSHALDFALWPRAAWLMHLENTLLFGAIVWLVGSLYRRLGLGLVAGGFATLCYVFAGHAQTVGWISARNNLFATLFGLGSLLCHVKADAEGARRPLALRVGSAALLGAALLSAEFGVGVLGFLLAHALCYRRGSIFARVSALWPQAGVLLGWLAAYAAGGYGTHGWGFYHSPVEEPVAFALHLATAVPIYAATQLTIPIASGSGFAPNALAVMTALSLLILFLLRNPLRDALRAEPTARFLALGAVLALAPLGASMAQDRLAGFVAFGASGIVALIVTRGLGSAVCSKSAAGLYRVHTWVVPFLFVPNLMGTATSNAVGGGTTALARALPEASRGVVVLNAPGFLPASYQPFIREFEGRPKAPPIDVLYAGAAPIEISRPDATSLEVYVERGWLKTTLEQLQRDPSKTPFHAGDEVVLPRMRVKVLEVNGGGAPTRVRFDFGATLESLSFDWLRWEDKEPKPWRLPAIGEHQSLPRVIPF